LGAGKGGSDFDPKGRSDAEVTRYCQSFMIELYRNIAEDTDVPAGDIGIGRRENGYRFGQYKRLTNRYESGVITGKGLDWGGSLVRTKATGYGTAIFVTRMLGVRGEELNGKRCVVSGSGNVAIFAIEKVHELGGIVVACSDSNGYVYDEDGVDLTLLKHIKLEKRGRLRDYAQQRSSTRYKERGNIWEVPCDVALPSATQNEINGRDAAELVKNGCIAVGEGANMPTTPEGIRVFRESGVAFGPGKAANA